MKQNQISYEPKENSIVISITLKVFGEHPLNHDDPKNRLKLLKGAQNRLKEEIKQCEIRIEAEEIKNSGQLSIE